MSDKIPITDLIGDEKVFESSPKPRKSKPKLDLTILILIIIATLSIIGTVIYFKFALVPIDNSEILKYSSSESVSSAPRQVKGDKVNINTASKDELCTLYLIGEKKALSIISYREANGSFKRIEDIKNVKGIGDATFEKIKDKICI